MNDFEILFGDWGIIINYSFKIFFRFWLVKTERIIHYSQLLLTKYWTNDVKSAAPCRLLNRWPRKPGDKVMLFWWAEKQRAKWRNSFKNEEIFWMNNKAIIEFGFRRILRILQISEGVIHFGFRPLWITVTLLDLQNSSHPTQPHSIIAKYLARMNAMSSWLQRLILLPAVKWIICYIKAKCVYSVKKGVL